MPRDSKSTKPSGANSQPNHERPLARADERGTPDGFIPTPDHDEEAPFGGSLLSAAEELFTETQVRAVSSPIEYALGRDEIEVEISSFATKPTQDQRARRLKIEVMGRGPGRHQHDRFYFDGIDAGDILRLHTALGRAIRQAQRVGLLPAVEG